jgi:hypothetical protein
MINYLLVYASCFAAIVTAAGMIYLVGCFHPYDRNR